MFSYSGLFHGILGLVSLAAALISLVVLYRGNSVGKSPLGVCLTNLAVNQLGFALFGASTFISPSYFAEHWVWGTAGCNFFGFLKSYFQNVIFSCVLMLCIERYLNLIHLYKLYTPKVFYKLSIGLWLYSAIWALFPFFGWGRYEKKDFSCDLAIIPSHGHWKDYTFVLCFVFATFIIPSTVMFHLLGKTRRTMIVWKPNSNSKQIWFESTQISAVTFSMAVFVFVLFCVLNFFGFLDWLTVLLTGDRKFYFETLHSALTHGIVLVNPLWYLSGVSSIRDELGRYYVEYSLKGSSKV